MKTSVGVPMLRQASIRVVAEVSLSLGLRNKRENDRPTPGDVFRLPAPACCFLLKDVPSMPIAILAMLTVAVIERHRGLKCVLAKLRILALRLSG